MSEIINFKTSPKTDARKYVLDFLANIDLVNSMEALIIGIEQETNDLITYSQYIHDTIEDELNYLSSIVASNPPEQWVQLRDSIDSQIRDNHNFIRFLIMVRTVNDSNELVDNEYHELILIAKEDKFLLINYNLDQTSLVSIMTADYLGEFEELDMEPMETKMSIC